MQSSLKTEILTFLCGSILTVTHCILTLYIAQAWSEWKLRHANTAVKITGFLIATFWVPILLFAVLMYLGLFNRSATTISLLALAFIVRLKWHVSLNLIGQKLPRLNGRMERVPILIISIGLIIVIAIRVSRGIIAPPLSWDALTYHLVKAAQWIQLGTWSSDNSPYSWQYYKYFPPQGDIFWAFTMLGTHSDAWLAVTGALITLALGIASFCFSKVCGTDTIRSTLVALASVSTPATLEMMTSYYVDTTSAVLVIAGATLLVYSTKANYTVISALAVVAMSIATGIKITYLPYMAIAIAIYINALIRFPRHWIISVGWTCCMSAVALFWQILMITNGHSPFYPMPLSILGWTIEPGVPELANALTNDRFTMPYLWELPQSIFRFLLKDDEWTNVHYNFTWVFLPLLGAALYKIYQIYRNQKIKDHWVLIALFFCGMATLYSFWSPGTISYRQIWLSNMGRFFLPLYISSLVLVALCSRPACTWFLVVVGAINLWFVWPDHYSRLDFAAAMIGFCILTLLCSSLFLTIISNQKRTLLIPALICFAVAVSALILSRVQFRHAFYMNTEHVFDTQRLPRRFPGAAVKLLDGEDNKTILYSSGYTGKIYRWFRYPFYGSKLQNNVVYTAPPEGKATIAGYKAWMTHLKKSHVNYVFFAAPMPIEADWVEDNQRHFHLRSSDPDGAWKLYRVID